MRCPRWPLSAAYLTGRACPKGSVLVLSTPSMVSAPSWRRPPPRWPLRSHGDHTSNKNVILLSRMLTSSLSSLFYLTTWPPSSRCFSFSWRLLPCDARSLALPTCAPRTTSHATLHRWGSHLFFLLSSHLHEMDSRWLSALIRALSHNILLAVKHLRDSFLGQVFCNYASVSVFLDAWLCTKQDYDI